MRLKSQKKLIQFEKNDIFLYFVLIYKKNSINNKKTKKTFIFEFEAVKKKLKNHSRKVWVLEFFFFGI